MPSRMVSNSGLEHKDKAKDLNRKRRISDGYRRDSIGHRKERSVYEAGAEWQRRYRLREVVPVDDSGSIVTPEPSIIAQEDEQKQWKSGSTRMQLLRNAGTVETSSKQLSSMGHEAASTCSMDAPYVPLSTEEPTTTTHDTRRTSAMSTASCT